MSLSSLGLIPRAKRAARPSQLHLGNSAEPREPRQEQLHKPQPSTNKPIQTQMVLEAPGPAPAPAPGRAGGEQRKPQ